MLGENRSDILSPKMSVADKLRNNGPKVRKSLTRSGRTSIPSTSTIMEPCAGDPCDTGIANACGGGAWGGGACITSSSGVQTSSATEWLYFLSMYLAMSALDVSGGGFGADRPASIASRLFASLLPPLEQNRLISSWVHRSCTSDFTRVQRMSSIRCISAHVPQIARPLFTEAHSGLLASQSAHSSLPGMAMCCSIVGSPPEPNGIKDPRGYEAAPSTSCLGCTAPQTCASLKARLGRGGLGKGAFRGGSTVTALGRLWRIGGKTVGGASLPHERQLGPWLPEIGRAHV